jgi:MFS family permease
MKIRTQKTEGQNPLWTRDFTIITLGSIVSMFGNALAGFAVSLLVLDYTQSTLLYAIYIIVYTLPQIIMPIFSGAVLDRFSRKRAIYTLDFISAGLYAIAAFLLSNGWFNFPILAVYCFLIGSINSIYLVAYDSFYPLLITEGNYSKAYSISSVLETMSALMIPVSAFVYNQVGITPLLAVDAVSFFVAALLETRIKAEEKYIAKQREDLAKQKERKKVSQLLFDVKEGFRYLWSEKGLLAVAVYFSFSSMAQGCSSVITLPYFKGNFENGEYIYMLVWGMALVGRAVGGGIHYRVKLPAKAKYAIALMVYIVISAIEGSYLYLPIKMMMPLTFLSGILGITSYTIRISATQSYVPDEKKGRFNGAFNMLNTLGALVGEAVAGLLTVVMSERYVLSMFMSLCVIAAIVFIGGNGKQVKKIYNVA